MATLTGKITDVTATPPETISAITVKAPSARVGGGTGLIVSSPATVDFDRDTGDVTISGLTGGLSWLYLEGEGWSDSIALSVAEGMISLVEAIANASSAPGIIDYLRLLADFKIRFDEIAQDAVDAAAENIKWVKRDLATGEDLNTVIEPGIYTAPTYTRANSLINKPPLEAIQSATLTVTATGDMVRQEWQKTSLVGQDQVGMWRHKDSTGAWSQWAPLENPWYKGTIPSNADLNDYTTPGLYGVPTYSVADSLSNKPPIEALQSASLTVTSTGGGAVKQRWEKTSLVGQDQVEVVRHRDTTGAWSEWARPAGAGSSGGEDTGTAAKIDMKRQLSRLRRGGVIGVGERTPVSLSFDHGFVHFRDKVLPHLIRLGLPATVAVNPDTLNKAGESAGVTFADLQSWSLNHGIEIAHHSRSHLDAPTLDTEGYEQAILSTIPEFETNMPEVVADAYIMPGVGGTGYDGFGAGLPPSRWWEHEVGRMILANFPVVTAALLGQAVPVTGTPVQTIDRAGVDITSWAKVAEDKIKSLYGTGFGMAVFNHPSKIGGSIAEARLVQFLEFLASERAAGRIEVLTVSGFAWAKTGENYSLDIAENMWSGDVATITIDAMFTNMKGGQFAIMGEATTTESLTIRATSDVGGLDAGGARSVKAGETVYVPFSIPKSATTLTVTCPESINNRRVMAI